LAQAVRRQPGPLPISTYSSAMGATRLCLLSPTALCLQARLVPLLLAALATESLAAGNMAGMIVQSGAAMEQGNCSSSDESSLLVKQSSIRLSLQNGSDGSFLQASPTCHQANPDGTSNNLDVCGSYGSCDPQNPLSHLSAWHMPEASDIAIGRTCKVECNNDNSGHCYLGGNSINSQCSYEGCKKLCIMPPNDKVCITGVCFKAGRKSRNGCPAFQCHYHGFCTNGEVCFSPSDNGCYKTIKHFVLHWKYCSDCPSLSKPTPVPEPEPTRRPSPSRQPRPGLVLGLEEAETKQSVNKP